MKRIRFDDYDKDQEIPSLETGPLRQMDLVRYAGASGDFNPIHNDPEFARSVGLDGTIAHGMYVMSQIGRMCSNWVHPLQIKKFSVKFKGMVRPGDKIICKGRVKKKKEEDGERLLFVDVDALSETGEIRVSGELVVKCD